MENDSIVFHGNLQQLLEKVETGEMIPKLQASHAPMCKFFTAYYVISGIRHVVPLVHGPTGSAGRHGQVGADGLSPSLDRRISTN
jgi:nitrogenase molybdenum-iron protein alpha/beta subunit